VTTKKKAASELTKPDNAALNTILFPSEKSIQPDWILKKHKQYMEDHGMPHEHSNVRAVQHDDHSITIATSYQIEVDGKPVDLHAIVANDGTLICHTTPYVTYDSAVDLVETIIDRFPKVFQTDGGGHDEHGHAGHHRSAPTSENAKRARRTR